jgi:hypothetical protein
MFVANFKESALHAKIVLTNGWYLSVQILNLLFLSLPLGGRLGGGFYK